MVATPSIPAPDALFPLVPPLPLPEGRSAEEIYTFLSSLELGDAPKQEILNYCSEDWKRFVYTYGLVADLGGTCLELGANPYFTTMLLRHFTSLELTLANYFGPQFDPLSYQRVTIDSPARSGARLEETLAFHHFNTEGETFPFPDDSFDVVLFCEILEHLQNDPLRVLGEIKRVLRPGGRLVLSTPNVSRLENVCRMVAGVNLYDPYSGYGPYGRHNREYNKHELHGLLTHAGFDVEILFSADVHPNRAAAYFPIEPLVQMLRPREHDLGQYLFSRSVNARPSRERRPSWLYRSYPPGEIEP